MFSTNGRVSAKEQRMTLRLGVVGVGHLGKEHARILAGMEGVQLVGVADPHAAQAGAVAQRCGSRAFADHRQLLPLVDAAVVAAPTMHHHAVARDFLERGIPLLVEKPLAVTPAQADELVELAGRRRTVLQVGHIERFNPAFEELRRRPLRPRYITCERYGTFTGRSTDIGAVLDLMIHDIDLVLALVTAPVARVEALGVAVLGGHEDAVQARVTFADGCLADLTASRVHPAPVRRMHLWAPEGFVAVDFTRRHLTLAQPDAHLGRPGFDSRRLDPATLATVRNDLFGRHLLVQEVDCNTTDQLTCELEDFVHCVRTGDRPRVDGAAGRDALHLAGRILDSVHSHAWEGDPAGPVGPSRLPLPLGLLFPRPEQKSAA
jgi:predicted dehydrogenase